MIKRVKYKDEFFCHIIRGRFAAVFQMWRRPVMFQTKRAYVALTAELERDHKRPAAAIGGLGNFRKWFRLFHRTHRSVIKHR